MDDVISLPGTTSCEKVPILMLCLGSIGKDRVIRESCYKGAIGKCHFPIIPLNNSMVIIGTYNMMMLYPN